MTSFPAKKHTNKSVSLRSILRWKPCRKPASHASMYCPAAKSTCWRVGACGTLYQHVPLPLDSSQADKCPWTLALPRRCRKITFLNFVSGYCFSWFFMTFPTTFSCPRPLYVTWECFHLHPSTSYHCLDHY